MAPPVALTIAGSDSGGGAGIQADLKAMAFAGVHGTSVVTALTAQNSQGVQDIHGVPAEFVREQIRSVTGDMAVRATKTGMLFSKPIIETVVDEREAFGQLIVDPVMVAATGDRLLQEEAEQTLVNELLPRADIITPNVPEAAIIAEWLGVKDPGDRKQLSRLLADRLNGPDVLLKGGHDPGERAIDYLALRDGETVSVEAPWVETENTHGSGCAYSSLIAAHLALVATRDTAIQRAKLQVTAALQNSYRPGKGKGTLDFLRSEPTPEYHQVGGRSQQVLNL